MSNQFEQIRAEVRTLTSNLEILSKRLRKIEVLPRLSTATGIDEFLELRDVYEDSYIDQAGQFVRVNSDETGLEFGPAGVACVEFECGSPGWRAYGGNPIRTLVHETAFQLDADGDARGAYSVELQQSRFADDEVAAAEFGIISGGEGNQIVAGADYCAIIGSWNYVAPISSNGIPYLCFIQGSSNQISGDESYHVHTIGEAHDIRDVNYGVFLGAAHDTRATGTATDSAFGVFAALEGNEFNASTPFYYPTYCAIIGLGNEMRGDVYNSYQFSEANLMDGGSVAGTTVWSCMQVGYGNYFKNVEHNFAFGQQLQSVNPTSSTNYYDGRVLMGDGAVKWPTGQVGGYNQGSIFSQGTAITSWPAAFTTSRFQFPVIVDSVWYFVAYIGGTEQGCANSYAWKIEGVVENDGGTTTILVQTVTNVYRDVATKEWQAAADDANDRLIFQYRDTAGPDATDCNIQFLLHTIEVGWAA